MVAPMVAVRHDRQGTTNTNVSIQKRHGSHVRNEGMMPVPEGKQTTDKTGETV